MPTVATPSKVSYQGKAEVGREANSAITVENAPELTSLSGHRSLDGSPVQPHDAAFVCAGRVN
jgi:hypothetical protein